MSSPRVNVGLGEVSGILCSSLSRRTAVPVANFVRLDVNDTQGPVTELSVGDFQVLAGTP